MDNQNQPKWYFKTWSLIASFFCVGPFMLPLLWVNPRFSKRLKVIVSAVVIIFTLILTILLARAISSLGSYYQFMLDEKI